MTKRYAALLSAVNVGGRRVPMAQLREVLSGLGYAEVATYLASGNAVFATGEDQREASGRIEEALQRRFGFAIPCLVRDGDYLASVIRDCPFPADEIPGKFLHATFYSAPVGEDRYAEIDREAFRPEEFRFGDRVMYLHLPGGAGRSPLAAALARTPGRLGGITATGRNWNTVTALAGLTGPEG